MKKLGYPRKEKLKQKKDIGNLFEKGKWKTCHQLRIIFYKDKTNENNNLFGVSVSKRYFKKAVDRNRIKRLMRECYRLNKEIYLQSFGEGSIAMLFWISKDLPQHYSEVEKEFLKLCDKVRNLQKVK